MSNLSLAVEVFDEEETFDSAKIKFSKLLSAINNDLVETEDSEEETFLDFTFNKYKDLIEDNFEMFINFIVKDIKFTLNQCSYPDVFEIKLLDQELMYGWVVILAGAHS